MKKEKIVVKISKLANNSGQLDWLPKNPRQWTQSDIDRTKKSIEEDPDFLEDRPLLVTAEMIVFGGNLRLTAARSLKMKEVPAVVYTPENEEDKETIKRRTIKDNGSFGAWDYDALANEWDNGRLPDWGVPVWEMEQEGKQEEERKEVNEDDFDEEKDGILVRCKPGDIWQLGDHRLMCGDSTDLETVKTLMGGGES
jgi:hypothetical protein